MGSLLKLASVVMLSLLSAGAIGCASSYDGAPASAAASDGMMCPKCETVWVARVVGQGTKVQRLVSERNMTCPDCDQMAKSQLTGDGKVMLHECPTCKVTPQRVRRTTISHPKATHRRSQSCLDRAAASDQRFPLRRCGT